MQIIGTEKGIQTKQEKKSMLSRYQDLNHIHPQHQKNKIKMIPSSWRHKTIIVIRENEWKRLTITKKKPCLRSSSSSSKYRKLESKREHFSAKR